MLGLPGQTCIDVDVGNQRTIHHHWIRGDGDDDKTPKWRSYGLIGRKTQQTQQNKTVFFVGSRCHKETRGERRWAVVDGQGQSAVDVAAGAG